MKLVKNLLSDTSVNLSVVAETTELTSLKNHTLGHFVDRVKLPGFRQGKAPLTLVEKQVDPAELQNEFLEEAINHLYKKAIDEAQIRPIERPEISIKKFVPFTTLEFDAKVSVIGKIVLPDYTKLKVVKPKVSVTEKDVQGVMKTLQTRMANKKEVSRAAKNGDELIIDFNGVDNNNKAIAGADGKDYHLILGSKSFIPGFEENLIGLKAGQEKTFELKFPKDYGVNTIANKTVKFTVKVSKVQEFQVEDLNDAFAAKAGPFKTIKDLSDDIRKQLQHERRHEADRNFESEIVKQITEKSKVIVPPALVDDQVERTLEELKQNLVYRGQTYQEYLDQEGVTDEENRKLLVPGATERVKAGLVLSEISEKEKITVNDKELDTRMEVLQKQYKDDQMQAELSKPEARRDIASRIVTEKTLDRLTELNSK